MNSTSIRRRRWVRAAACAVVMGTQAGVAQAQISVDPMVLTARDTAPMVIRVYNPDARPTQVVIGTGDWDRGRHGETRWSALGTQARSAIQPFWAAALSIAYSPLT